MPVTLADILSFTTGLRQIPPLGLKEIGAIIISYLRNLDTKIYPMADACFNNILSCQPVTKIETAFFQRWMRGYPTLFTILEGCDTEYPWMCISLH